MIAPLPLALDASPVWLSLAVACAATTIAAPIGIFVAWRLALGRPFPGKLLLETVFTLPLVLPPTVVGYGLLQILGQGTALGRFLNETLHIRLLFTLPGAIIAAVVMCLPLLVRTAQAAFLAVDTELLEIGRTLGASELRLLIAVLVPISFRGLLAGLTLAFARALGEFGATLMVAGSVSGKTQTLPLALYDAVLAGDDATALRDALLLTGIAFALMGTAAWWGTGLARARGERV